jgi:hypothetical protein
MERDAELFAALSIAQQLPHPQALVKLCSAGQERPRVQMPMHGYSLRPCMRRGAGIVYISLSFYLSMCMRQCLCMYDCVRVGREGALGRI